MQQQYEQAQDTHGNKLAQSKGRDNRMWSRWIQGFVIEVPSLARSTSPFGEGVEHNAHHEGHLGPPYSPHALTNTRCRDSTMGHLRVVTEPVQLATLGGGHRIRTNAWGYLHNLIGSSRSVPELYTTMIELRNNNKPLGANAPKRNKL